MRLEVIVRNAGGRVVDMVGAMTPTNTAVVPVAFVEPGSEIEAVVRDKEGKFLGQFYAVNAFTTKNITATRLGDGGIAVTDDASNTYTRE
jgi:hypothetical protein